MDLLYQRLPIDNWIEIRHDLLDFFKQQNIEIPLMSRLFYLNEGKTLATDEFRQVKSLCALISKLGWDSQWLCTAIVVVYNKDAIVPHVDSEGAEFSLILPLMNTEQTFTVFYESDSDPIKTYQPNSSVGYFGFAKNAQLREIDRIEMTEPTLIKIQVPHAVEVNHNLPRIVLSLRLKNI